MYLQKRPLSENEKSLPLAKYYDLPIEMPDPSTMQIINAGPMDPRDVPPPERFPDIMLPPGQYGKIETGYCVLPDGTGYLAVYKRFDPRITVQMRRWFGSWMNVYSRRTIPSEGNLRYKIWNPIEHIDHHFVNGRDGSDGVSTLETLDLGAGEEPIGSVHHTIPESEYPLYGVPEEKLKAYKAMGCSLRIAWESFDIPGSHFCVGVTRPHPLGGFEQLTREWMGYKPVDGKLVRDDYPVTEEYLKNIIIHNIMELQHMVKFLPAVYEEYKDKPLDED